MKERFHLAFNEIGENLEKIKQVLRELDRIDLLSRDYVIEGRVYGVHWFYISSSDPALEVIRRRFRENGWKLWERLERSFDVDELLQCKLVRLIVTRAAKGDGGPAHGTTYDMSKACRNCGVGAVQTSGLRVRPSDISKNADIYQPFSLEVIVSGRVARAFRERGLKGFELRPVVSYVDDKELDYYQIIPSVYMPRISLTTRNFRRHEKDFCNVCQRGGYSSHIEEPVELHYDNLDEKYLEKADIFWTYEYLGVSMIREPFKNSMFAQPYMLAKPNVMKIFNELKVRYVLFEPVIVNGKPDITKWPRK